MIQTIDEIRYEIEEQEFINSIFELDMSQRILSTILWFDFNELLKKEK